MNALTISELARELSCSESTLRDLVRRNRIPHFRIGTAIRFDRAAVDRWRADGGTAGVRGGPRPADTPGPRSGYASGWRTAAGPRRGRDR
jgi:excisionase family DNA binding protein